MPVILRFGIQFGFGDKTVAEVCKQYDIDADFFTEIINIFIDKDYFPQTHLQEFSVKTIIDFLIKSHQDYRKNKIPHIEKLIDSLEWDSSETKKNKALIKNFFLQYKTEVIEHMDYEETIVYPYSIKMEKILNNEQTLSIKELRKYAINIYADTHDDIEEKLLDLKNILIKYLPPSSNLETEQMVLFEIFRLEKDLNNHSRIEEKVLIPKIKLIETELKQMI
ncbi:MAG: hemerythrin domain-containing protein [Bacteroidales bacterium]|nr:hemerythrin domain-containing protein [Bacteroidales bacterium]